MACLGGSHNGGVWPLLGRPFTCRAEVTWWKVNQRASSSSVWSTFNWKRDGTELTGSVVLNVFLSLTCVWAGLTCVWAGLTSAWQPSMKEVRGKGQCCEEL